MIEEELISLGFNKDTLRLLLDKKTLLKLPIKYATKEELYEVKNSWFFNPVYFYSKIIKPIKGEVGHDNKFRYLYDQYTT